MFEISATSFRAGPTLEENFSGPGRFQKKIDPKVLQIGGHFLCNTTIFAELFVDADTVLQIGSRLVLSALTCADPYYRVEQKRIFFELFLSYIIRW